MRVLIVFLGLITLACKTDKKYHDSAVTDQTVQENDAVAGIIPFQKGLDEEFKDPETSPLPDRYRKNFEGLDFFKPNTDFVVTANLERTPNAVPFMMATTTDRMTKEVVYGIARFQLDGKEYSLEIYQSSEQDMDDGDEDYLFLPFLDETNGAETYAGGRYMDLTVPEASASTILLDFNKAYNPYCVYNKKFSCPIVPSANTLRIKVLAGVKAFGK